MEKFTLSRQKIVSFGRDFKHPVQDCIEVAGPLAATACKHSLWITCYNSVWITTL